MAAGRLIDEDPELAYEHAKAAASRAGRVDVVREAAALTAYTVGKYDEALKEVRAMRRLSGSMALRAVEADCERALGRPERALEIFSETDLGTLEAADQVEMIIVAASARADLEETEAGLIMVDNALEQLPADFDEEVTARLKSVKADLLRKLGREDEAAEIEAELPQIVEELEILDLEEVMDSDIDSQRSDLRACKVPLVEAFESLLLDLDGVCYLGDAPVQDAAEAINSAREKGMVDLYVTNNASRTPDQVAEKLNGLGIEAVAEHVMTAALDIVGIVSSDLEPGSKVLVVGGAGLTEAVTQAGFELVQSADEEPAAVVQGWSADIDWAKLSEVAFALDKGARYYASNLDASLPQERGFALGNGALVAAVETCTGKRPFAGGKPFPGIYRKAAELGGANRRALSVGDRLETDIKGANAARIPALHVLTGVHGPRDVVMAQSLQRPAYVGLTLAALHETHPRANHHMDGTWTCGDSESVAVDRWGEITVGGELLTEGSTLTLDNYRAVIAAAWEKLDLGHRVKCPDFKVVSNDDENEILPLPQSEETYTFDEDEELEVVEAPDEETVELTAEELAELDEIDEHLEADEAEELDD
ncbi:hydrolase [Boudabousia tangfeifanii]|uniref:Hydrolase n=1 Tax=Boudabousia tangfeifanii TaxID=1912795 RepID=A0A1D9MMG4_9ACTO|nr:hydrolase [Boudabousia tangfeifanii]